MQNLVGEPRHGHGRAVDGSTHAIHDGDQLATWRLANRRHASKCASKGNARQLSLCVCVSLSFGWTQFSDAGPLTMICDTMLHIRRPPCFPFLLH